MPATTDIWVNQEDGQPVFVVTAPANDGLLAMLRGEVLGQIRRLVGDRRVTVVFDREGWSPSFFRELDAQGFDVLTYRKGRSESWPVEEFNRVRGFVDGRRVEYDLAERSVEVVQGFWMREVRRRCEGGHQTAIVTTRKDLAIEVVAYRMFERWKQENFFRYMKQHFALDALVTYAVEPADPERTVPNPQRKVLGRELSKLRLALKGLEQRYGQQALAKGEGARFTRREKKRQEVLIEDIGVHRAQCQQMKERIAALPKRVALREVLDEQEIVRLSPEAKHFTNTIKMMAYRAETTLVRYVAPHYGKSEDEGRALVREMLLSSADIIPDPEAKRLTVRLHSLANARSNKALVKLCEMLNGLKIDYPGTDLTLWYEPPEVA